MRSGSPHGGTGGREKRLGARMGGGRRALGARVAQARFNDTDTPVPVAASPRGPAGRGWRVTMDHAHQKARGPHVPLVISTPGARSAPDTHGTPSGIWCRCRFSQRGSIGSLMLTSGACLLGLGLGLGLGLASAPSY